MLVPDTSLKTTGADHAAELGVKPKTIVTKLPLPAQIRSNTSERDRVADASLRTQKSLASATVAPSRTESDSHARDRSSDADARMKRLAAELAAAAPHSGSDADRRDRSPEPAPPKGKIGGSGPASIQGFVKDAKGQPIKGADLRIESRDGKQMFNTVKTDSKGRYISQRLEPGVYRVTLLVDGTVKASIANTQTKVNQATQLNFDFKTTSQAGAVAPKARKHMVWVPNRTGSHIGGTWVEVDDQGNERAESNIQTYTARRW
jgi:hypothetical protein